MRWDVDPLVELLGTPDLPMDAGTVVAIWMTAGTHRPTISRFVRCNDTVWRELEDPGAKLTNAEVAERLALAEGWKVCSIPVDDGETEYVNT